MNRSRIRKLGLVGLLLVSSAVLAYFAFVQRQPRRDAAKVQTTTPKEDYYCPMHPTYHSEKPGNCPVCSMKLVKLDAPSVSTSATAPAAPESPPSAAPAAPTPAAPVQDSPIFVPPEKQQLIGMRSVPAEMGTLTKEIRAVGKVSYDETRVTHIHSKVSGYIEEVFADSVGKPVRAGEPLFTIYSPDLVSTQQDYVLALKSRDLLKASTVTSAAQGSENLIAAARERLHLWDVTDQDIERLETEGKVKRAIPVYSPVTGIVTERAAYHHGTFVDPSKDLFTIVDLSQIWILGEIFETDLPFIRTGQTAEIELPYSGRAMHGRIEFIYPFLDPKSRTVQARVVFPNPGLSLKPGMFTNIRMDVSMGRQVLVPQDAVMNTGTEQYVFIDLGNGYVQPRQVKVASDAGDRVGILQGLKAGERVVTAANFLVDAESRLKGAFAGMGPPSQTRTTTPAAAGNQPIVVEVLEPKTAKTGMNFIRLLIKDREGKPITGAQVDVTLFMPQMGSMAPMTSKAKLAESGNGVYSGQIEFQMAWTWQTTVTVRKGSNMVGVAQTSITSR